MIDKRRTRRGQSRYEVRLRGGDGKERSRTFRTKKEAERYERSQHTALEQGLWVDPRAGKVTLEAWAREWGRTVVHLRPSTRRIYAANLRNHIVPQLGNIELGKLTPSLLRAWLSGLTTKIGAHGKPLAPGSVAQAYRTLNRVLVAAVDDELLGRNPLSGVRPPRVEPEPMRFLSHEEVATLVAAVDPRYRALVLVAAYTGLRAGELIGLRRQHVDLLRRTITVVEQVQYVGGQHLVLPPKSAAGRRSVAVPAVVTAALEDHLGHFAEPGLDGLLFPAPEGGFLRLENFRRRVWRPAVAEAGVAPLRIHDLRHTCASLAIAAGADVKVLQRMLGHASAALTLDRYGHLLPGQAESVASRLDEMARAATPAARAAVTPIRASAVDPETGTGR
ncbi:MAG: site-specific integrase [Actinobacteria bacterium]|nr:site-specific integrase [Actinomycetota bacterium]